MLTNGVCMITKVVITLALTLSFAAAASVKNPLPNWIDKSRESKGRCAPHTENVQPPASFRLPAEYEPAKAVTMGFSGYTSMLKDIARVVTNEGNAEVWASGRYAPSASSIPGVESELYETNSCAINTVWIRDYGPVGINEASGELAIVDSRYRHEGYRCDDDNIPTCVANQKSIAAYPMNLVLDGGNLMVDSKGNLFMTKRTYLWNNHLSKDQVDQRLKNFFNVHTVHAIDYAGYPYSPKDGTGHIDMFVKLLNDDTVLIAETSSAYFKDACDNAVAYFKSIKTPSGKDYKILRSPGWSSGRTWYTYTNSLIVNNVAIIPSFSSHMDKEAIAVKAYEDGMPGVKVRPVNSDSSIHAGGSIHCVTQLIPKI
jgi:agmatine/peptidylarginine deiminase